MGINDRLTGLMEVNGGADLNAFSDLCDCPVVVMEIE